jgi:hypothetical protein
LGDSDALTNQRLQRNHPSAEAAKSKKEGLSSVFPPGQFMSAEKPVGKGLPVVFPYSIDVPSWWKSHHVNTILWGEAVQVLLAVV